MKTQVTLPANLSDLKVTCPYCRQESLLKDWQIWIEPLAKIRENNLEITYIYSNAECPICKTIIDTWEEKEVSIGNIEVLKEVIENHLVEPVAILIQCPSCKIWNNFYDWKFEGIVKNLNVEIYNREEVSVSRKIQEVFVTKAICERCDYEVRLNNVRVNVPMKNEDVKKLLRNVEEAIVKNNNR